MRLTSLQLHSPELRLDDLSPGFNLVFAPHGETRQLISAALRCVLFGAPAGERAADDHRSICELDVLSSWGRFDLERVLSPEGDRFVARDSNGQNRGKWLRQRLLADMTEGAFAAIFTPRFGDHAAFEALVCQALGESGAAQRRASLEHLLRELEATRPWERQDRLAARLREQEARLSAELEQLHVTKSANSSRPTPGNETLCRQRIARWKSRLERTQALIDATRRQLDEEVSLLSASSRTDTGRTDSTDPLLARLESLNQELKLLGRQLRRAAMVRSTASEMGSEFELLECCQRDLSAQLEILLRRREALEQRLESGHPAPSRDSERLEVLEAKLIRLQEREHYCQQRIECWRDRLEQSGSEQLRPRREGRVGEVSRELADVRQQLAQLAQRDKQESELMLERMRSLLTDHRIPVIFEEASRTLRQLTDGELVAVRPRTWGNDVVIEHAHGKAVTFDVLSRGERDQVQLSLSLATAADATQRGHVFPLVLDDALRHVEPGRLRAAIELLRDHCRLHGQILLMTSQQNVATLCRSIGVASFYLDQTDGRAARGTSLGRAAEQSGAVDDDERSRFRGEPARTTAGSWPMVREIDWDCEEFPGELRDRTRSGGPSRDVSEEEVNHSEVEFPPESLRGTEYFLQLCDRVTEAPFATRAVSHAIEECGIYTIANFLHADPIRLAEQLHELDVSSSQLRCWQGQARLMCGVRKLRSYDAKILVACGVTSPEQLADIRPHELSEMVEAFVATPEGSRIVRSGSDFEISRITRWIRSVGRAPTPAIPRSQATAPRRNRDTRPVDSRHTATRRSSSSTPPDDREYAPSRGSRSSNLSRPRGERAEVEATLDPDLLPLKFFLEESSHVEAAPSIGPQMAKRLEKIGIVTVANLLTYEPADIAEHLEHRRVSAETVRQWQRQAELVCRIPQLRGHDAQILVACNVTTPEDLAARKPNELYSEIMPFVRSKAGQRILRQGKEPTVDEVTDWISWAQFARQLAA
jgi:hypothetical protein